MKDEVEKFVCKVEENKKNIANAIAHAYVDEIGGNLESYRDSFYHMIKNVKVYLLDSEEYKTKYEKDVLELLNKITNIVGYDVKPYFFKEIKFLEYPYDFLSRTNFIDYMDEEVLRLKKIYDKKFADYMTIGLNFESFYKINKFDDNSIKRLDNLINKVKHKAKFYHLKKLISHISDVDFGQISMVDELSDLSRRYNIRNINDLLKLHTEVSSFSIKENDLSKEEIEVLNKNRDDFRKRINKDKDYFLNVFEVSELQRKIEKIYNDNLFNEVFSRSMFKDFFDKYNISYSDMNFKKVIDVYLDLIDSVGLCFMANFGKEDECFCFFEDTLLDLNSKDQNTIILHEFIHSSEKNNECGTNFKYNCKCLNEALTEYLAQKSEEYLSDRLGIDRGYRKYFGTIYDCMFPLLEELKKSEIWQYVIKAKCYNDSDLLIDKIGLMNFNLINSCFNATCKNWQDKEIANKNLDKLIKVLEKIKKKNR